jgi:hypothetical protein
MPTVAWFYGIVIQMYYDDHQPPHFHARYGQATRSGASAAGKDRGSR